MQRAQQSPAEQQLLGDGRDRDDEHSEQDEGRSSGLLELLHDVLGLRLPVHVHDQLQERQDRELERDAGEQPERRRRPPAAGQAGDEPEVGSQAPPTLVPGDERERPDHADRLPDDGCQEDADVVADAIGLDAGGGRDDRARDDRGDDPNHPGHADVRESPTDRDAPVPPAGTWRGRRPLVVGRVSGRREPGRRGRRRRDG